MISQIFKTGGGAGIGSFVLVLKDGALLNVSAEKVRWSYDSGENLYLSIIDDSTEEALLPLSGYVDNEGILHLSGRDFDDNKTYEIAVGDENQSIELNTVDGITMGEGTIPTEGGGGDITLKTINDTSLKGEGNLELVDLNTDQYIYGEKSFGGALQIGAYNAGAGGFLSEGSISSTGMISLNLSADRQLVLSAKGYDLASSGFSFKDIYKSDASTTYTTTYRFPDRKAENKSYVIATTEDCGSKLYRHHFDVVLMHSDLASIPDGSAVHINVNALSSSGTAWETLGELDGGGFIIAAFGTISYPSTVYTPVFELKIFYKQLETLLLNIHDLAGDSVRSAAIATVGGGQTPSTWPIQDSVTAI